MANCDVLSNYLANSSLIFVKSLKQLLGLMLVSGCFYEKGVFVAVAFVESSGRTYSISVRGESEIEKCTLSVKLTFWGRGVKALTLRS